MEFIGNLLVLEDALSWSNIVMQYVTIENNDLSYDEIFTYSASNDLEVLNIGGQI